VLVARCGCAFHSCKSKSLESVDNERARRRCEIFLPLGLRVRNFMKTVGMMVFKERARVRKFVKGKGASFEEERKSSEGVDCERLDSGEGFRSDIDGRWFAMGRCVGGAGLLTSMSDCAREIT
jgi:hypothetical protein